MKKIKNYLALLVITILLLNSFSSTVYASSEIMKNEYFEEYFKNTENNELNNDNETVIKDENIIGNKNVVSDESSTTENEKIIEDNKEELDNDIDSNTINEDYGITTLEDKPSIGVKYRTHVQEDGWQYFVQSEAISGTTGRSLRLEGIEIELINSGENLNIKYQVHVQNIGWQDWKKNGEMAGTSGQSLRLEAIRICLEDSEEYSIMYRVHVQTIGWQDWKTDGEIAGTSGQSLRLEAIQIKIIPKQKKGRLCIDTPSKGNTYYSESNLTVQGWKMANVSNSSIKAYIDDTEVKSDIITYYNRKDVIEAILDYGTATQNPKSGFTFNITTANLNQGNHILKIVLFSENTELTTINTTFIVDKDIHVQYRTHVQTISWQGYVKDGEMSGTSGKSYRVEALNINLINASADAKILYRTHVQNIGWQGWKSNGEMTGTSGNAYRIEAIEIKLEKLDSYTVEYQVHVQDYGWSNWYIDGETAGTVGQSKRIEAIRIRLVPKYKRANTGMDVSAHQGKIDWNLVKQSGQIDFVMLRCGYGKDDTSQDDAYFTRNLAECERLGIPYGIYLYSYALTGNAAYSEAEHVLRLINGHYPSYGIWIDMEDADGYKARYGEEYGIHMEKENDQYTNNVLTDICINFCNKIEQYGYRAGVYASYNWLTNRLNDGRIDKFDIWVAQWNYKCDYNKPYIIWQYTNNGSVPGILTPVDMDKYCK